MTQPERLIALISQTLQPSTSTEQRHALERELNNMIEQDPSTLFLELVSIIPNDSIEPSIRVMSAVLLKNSFENHYERVSGKETFRNSLLHAYVAFSGDLIAAKKFNPILAFILSKMMFNHDGEVCDAFLVDQVTKWLDAPFTHANLALFILSEYVKDEVANEQLPWLLQAIYPKLLFALVNSNEIRIKHDVLVVFKDSLHMLEVLHSMEIKDIVLFLGSILPDWLRAMNLCLHANNSRISYLVFLGIAALQESFPKLLDSHIDIIYESFPVYLGLEMERYVKEKVLEGHDVANDSAAIEGYSIPLEETQNDIRETLMLQLLRFLTLTVKNGKYFSKNRFTTETFHCIQLMQITSDQRELWSNDADAFVSETDEETFKFCVRVAVAELFEAIMNSSFQDFAVSFCSTLTSEQFAGEIATLSRTTNQWTLMEAYLYALEVIYYSRSKHVTEYGVVLSNPLSFVNAVVLGMLGADTPSFLRGRALRFIGLVSSKLDANTAHSVFLEAVKAFAQNDDIPLRYLAMDAISKFSQVLPVSSLSPGIAQFFPSALGLLASGDCPEEAISKILELLLLLIQKNPEWARPFEQQLAPALLYLYTSFPFEHMIGDVVTNLVQILVKDEKYRVSFEERVLPQVAKSLTAPLSYGDEDNGIAAGIDFMTSMIKLSPKVENPFYGRVIVPALIDYLLKCPNTSTHQVIVYRDPLIFTLIPEGFSQPLIVAAVDLVQKALSPTTLESGSLYISDFASALIMKLGHELTPVVPNLCNILLERMELGKSSVYTRCLLSVYLHLLYHPSLFQMAFDILKANPAKLAMFIDAWVSLFPEFQPAAHFKTSVLVMLKIVNLNDPALAGIVVKGDPVNVDPNAEASGRIITRSRAKTSAVRYQMIPFAVKAMQLILNDVRESFLSSGNVGANTHPSPNRAKAVTHAEHDDEEDEDWEDVDETVAALQDIPIDLLLNPDSVLDESDEEEKLLDHPASHVNMTETLKAALQTAAHLYKPLVHENMSKSNLDLLAKIISS